MKLTELSIRSLKNSRVQTWLIASFIRYPERWFGEIMHFGGIEPADPIASELAGKPPSLSLRREPAGPAQAQIPAEAMPSCSSAAISDVRSATQALFSCPVLIEETQDPEIEERYFVVRVPATGSLESVAQKSLEWHRRLGDWAPGHESDFRLAIVYVNEE